MKQVFLSGQGEVAVLEAPVPNRLRNSILVQNAFSLISAGTEGTAVTKNSGLKGLYEKILNSRDKAGQVWNMVEKQGIKNTFTLIQNKLNDYTPLGYSSSGVVLEVNGTNTGFKPGQHVACMGTGFANHAEYIVVPKNMACIIPDDVSLEAASFASLACIAMQGIRRTELSSGEFLAIIGLGQIGQIALRLALVMGYRVCGFDINQDRVNHAKKFSGTPLVFNSMTTDPVTRINEITSGQGIDGVVICASSKSDEIINQAFAMCRKRGRVSIVGDIGLKLNRAAMYAKELEVRLSCSYGPGRYDPDYELAGIDYPPAYARWTEGRNLQLFLSLLAEKRIQIADLISAKIDIEDAPKAYALIKSGDPKIFGVLLNYRLPVTPAPPLKPYLCVYQKETHCIKKDVMQIGLIGVGAYAKNVHVPNLQKIRGVKIRGIVSKSGASAAVIAKKVKAHYAASDINELLKDDRIDAVIISTRHRTHAQMVIDTLAAGKHVFVEKPMATTIEDCIKIVRMQQKTKRVVRVGFNRRFSPYLRAMKMAVGKGKKLLNVRVNVGDIGDHWSNTLEEGGRLLGEGVHFFDLANWMMESPPVALSAQFVGEPDALNPDASVSICYENGSVANIVYTSMGHVGCGKEYFELFGNGRMVVMDDYRKIKGFGCKISASRKQRGDKGQLGSLEEFIQAIKTGIDRGGADEFAGLLATTIAQSVLQSAVNGKKIYLRLPLKIALLHNGLVAFKK